MDDNNQELYPMAPTYGQNKNDVESPSRQSEVLRQSKCIKYIAYFSVNPFISIFSSLNWNSDHIMCPCVFASIQ